MQRASTILGILILFGIGVFAVAGGFSGGGGTYEIPSDPVPAAVLVAAIVAVVILTGVTGGGLAFVFNWLNAQLTKDKPGALSEAKVDANPVAPYVPAYSYKATPENVETRQWVIGSVIALALLAGYVVLGNSGAFVKNAQAFFATTFEVPLGQEKAAVPLWVIPVGSIFLILGGIGATGAGLAVWFYKTQEEKDKAAKLGPAWPAAEIAALELKLKPEFVLERARQMTMMDKALIAGNIFIVLVLLGITAVWVAPAFNEIFAVDAARFNPTAVPTPAVVAAPVAGAPGAPSKEELEKELAALPAGNATAGQTTFAGQACAACHVVTGETATVGPALTHAVADAQKYKPDYSPELYFYESITHPGAFVVPGFADGTMPPNFKDVLTPQQISDLVAYLASLK